MCRVEIKKVTYNGFGIGFYEDKTVFVPFAIPGDLLDIKLSYTKKNIIFAEIEKIIEPSNLRIISKCSAFLECGGCDWLNVSYETQLNFKNIIVKDIFKKIDSLTILSIKASPNVFYYRNKTVLPLKEKNNIPTIGMYKRNSHEIVDNLECKIQDKIFFEIADVVKEYIKLSKIRIYDESNSKGNLRYLGVRNSNNTGEIIVYLITKNRRLPFSNLLVKRLIEKFPRIVGIIQNINPRPVNTILGNDEKLLWGVPYFYEKVEKYLFKVNYRSFLQINTKQACEMYKFIKNLINQNDVVIDAFSGIGSIGIFVAEKANKVFCIEINENANNDAIENAKINNVNNCCFINDTVENILPEICDNNKIDSIIFDPPRKGLQKETIDFVSKFNIKKIIYVSCNPTTQQRDLILFKNNEYKTTFIQPFDMFPQTYHVETICLLEKL